jgi:hypothetical protein
MNITTSITGDCRFISIGVTDATNNSPLLINVYNGSDIHEISTTTSSTGTYSTAILLSSTIGTQSGIFSIEITDVVAGISMLSAELGKCELDCCIAKKVDSLLSCDCECTQCSHTMITAERVHLLIVAIETDLAQIEGGPSAANTAIITNTNTKYKKALELCSDCCGCNC